MLDAYWPLGIVIIHNLVPISIDVFSLFFSSRIICPFILAIIGKQIGRTIYSREELGLPGIDERRQIARSDFNSLDQIIEHKAEIVRKFVDLPLNIKRDYLKKFIYLSDFDHTDTANTIALIKQFDEAYHREVTRVENFGFATEISRSCHFLKDVDSLIQVNKTSA